MHLANKEKAWTFFLSNCVQVAFNGSGGQFGDFLWPYGYHCGVVSFTIHFCNYFLKTKMQEESGIVTPTSLKKMKEEKKRKKCVWRSTIYSVNQRCYLTQFPLVILITLMKPKNTKDFSCTAWLWKRGLILLNLPPPHFPSFTQCVNLSSFITIITTIFTTMTIKPSANMFQTLQLRMSALLEPKC